MDLSKNPKILFIIEYFAPHIGGVERVIEEVGTRLAKQGLSINIFSTDEPISLPTATLLSTRFFGLFSMYSYKDMTITRMRLPDFGKRYLFPILSFPFLFLFYNDVNLVHSSNNYTIALPAWLFAKLTRKKITISVWEIWATKWVERMGFVVGLLHLAYERVILSLPFDHYFVPSRFVGNQLINKKPVTLAPLAGRNLRYSLNKKMMLRKHFALEKQFVFLYYGRRGISKGLEILIAAFRQLRRNQRNIHLLCVTSPDDQSPEVNITILPQVPDNELSSYLSMADAVVIPDLTASFGLNALEVSEMGRPLIVTTAGALPEVSFGKIIFVQPGSVKELVRGMKLALQGKWQKIPTKHFSWDTTAREYEKGFAAHTLPRER